MSLKKIATKISNASYFNFSHLLVFIMGGLIIYGATDPRPEIVTKIVTETVSVTDTFLVEIEGPKEIIENYYYLYNVKHNDSLYKISYKYYGDPMKWNIIAKANNINNPGIIWPYTTLKIPILK